MKRMKNDTAFDGFYTRLISWPCFVLLLLLVIFSSYCTVLVYPVTEQAVFMKANWFRMLLAGGLFLLALTFAQPLLARINERLEKDERSFCLCRRILLALVTVMALVWTFATQYAPYFDRLWVQQAAAHLLQGNVDDLVGTGYIRAYQNQTGLMLFSWAFAAVFGPNNTIAFEMMNALCVPAIFAVLSSIGGELKLTRLTQLIILALGLVFLPVTLYTSFVYGTIPGLLLALIAVREELVFLRSGKYRHILVSAAAIALSVCLKQNYLIFWIGLTLHLVFSLMANREYRRMMTVFSLILAFLFQQFVPGMVLKKLTGVSMEKGSSSLSWIAMSLQDDEKTNPGWWNSYNDDSWYIYSDLNTEAQVEMSMESIRDSLAHFRQDPGFALRYFTQKEASMWCDPAFQATTMFQGKKNANDVPQWVWHFMSLPGALAANRILDPLQTLVYLGCFLWLLLQKGREGRQPALLALMIFLGTFVFHTFWEAKGQYTLAAFVLLLPVAAAGWEAACRQLTGVLQRRSMTRPHWSVDSAVYLLLTIVCCGIVFAVRSCGGLDLLTRDTATVAERNHAVVQEYYQSWIEDGTYAIQDENGRSLCAAGTISDTNIQPMKLDTYRGKTCISFGMPQLYMTALDGNVLFLPYEGTAAQQWRILPADEENSFMIRGDSGFLCRGENGELCLSEQADISSVWFLKR